MKSGVGVKLGFAQIRYLTPEDNILEEDERPHDYDFLEDLVLRNHPRMRRVVVPSFPTQPMMYAFLHWCDDTNLEDLDELARTGKLEEDHLLTGLLVHPMSINCLTCGAGLRLVTPDMGYPLAGAKLRRQKHKFQPNCPACHNDIRMSVAEFLDDFLNDGYGAQDTVDSDEPAEGPFS